MAKYMSILCPNLRAHRGKTTCNCLLKIYAVPAVFEEFLFCPKCGAHWHVVRNEHGAVTTTIISRAIKIKTERTPMHVIGVRQREELSQDKIARIRQQNLRNEAKIKKIKKDNANA